MAESPVKSSTENSPGLLRSSSVVSVMTLVSRVLGLIRDVVVAQYFGARADAFFVAFKIPNFFRRLFAEGAFSVAFVPVLSEYRRLRPLDEVRLLIARVSGLLGMALLAITVLAVLFADYLPWVFSPGFRDDPAKFALTGDLLRITFPYLLFISLTAFASSVLNAYGRFAVPAFTPVLLNVCLIFAAVVMSDWFEEPLFALAWGVFLAGLVQLVFQLPFVARLGLLVRPVYVRHDEGVSRIGKLMIPALFGVSVSQINLLLDTLLASFLESGSVSWLYYSDRLNNLPLGVFAIAIGVVILPSLSGKHAANDGDAFSRTLDWAVRMVFLLALPAALALVVLATPLMSTIFYHGEITAYDIGKMTMSLQAYGSGLLAFMLIKVLAPGYYARQDTKTPVKIGIQAMVVNMVLNLALVFPLQHVGLALATSLSAYYNVFMLYRGLRKTDAYQHQSGWLTFILKLLAANLALFGVMFWLMGGAGQWLEWSALDRSLWLTVIVVAGVVTYFAVLIAAGLRLRHLRGSVF
ncbi:MAG: murein biosynthesis integral membrane protein MurJ [Oceanospirillaceae bacterium]|uniref:murein biosynthesis integral membrane protein MurJ n=1 Tax=unclassified Thalassolituus TaxID=2624967 RepID=UPI000C4F92FF|nr:MULTISPECIES: murein biosynthesis integral membrane protein MurJ [unclassified Thalassolituus]MAS24613.1 murein biosynthesis integral membrane protein MurJ [Oceanospirillaceae bacterium]MAY00918.1 murein biosynthesis integral membrane protein MurJ [Oceanospirillaceae bacterium]MBS52725.1 murein biosynthesis integral membrane protein MurJ [Oceanospirillaceae bacterium]